MPGRPGPVSAPLLLTVDLCLLFASAGSDVWASGQETAPVVIDLPRALELAAKNNPELKAAESDIDVASAQRDRAASGHWPTLRAQAGWTEYRRRQRLYPPTSPGDPAGARIPPCQMQEDVVFVVLSGRVTFHSDGDDTVVAPPGAVFIPGGATTRSMEAHQPSLVLAVLCRR